MPAKNQAPVTAFSITDTALACVVIDKNSQVAEQYTVPFQQIPIGSVGLHTKVLGEAIAQIKDQLSGIKGQVVVSLPDSLCFSRTHQMPIMNWQDVDNAIEWQLEKILPIPKTDVYFDWQLLNQDEHNLNVLVVAIQKPVLDTVVAAFEQHQIQPLGVLPAAPALAQAFVQPEETAILVDLGPYTSAVSLVINQASRFTLTHKYTSNNQNEVSQALQQTSQSVISLVRSQQLDSVPILLCGESANDQIAQWLQSYLSTEVKVVETPVNSNLHQAYAVAVASGLELATHQRVNLLPDSLDELYRTTHLADRIQNHLRWLLPVYVLIAVIGIGSYIFTFVQAQATGRRLQQLSQSNQEITYNAQELTKINQSSQKIINLFPLKSIPVDQIELITDQSLSGIQVSQFEYDRVSKQIEVTGTAADRDVLTEYVEYLRANQSISRVSVPLESYEKTTDLAFTLTVVLP